MSALDVVVVGGGPAGAAATLRAADAGARVALLERSEYRGWRPGETLAPSVRVPLSALGALDRLGADEVEPSEEIRSAWGTSELRERNFIFDPYGSGWHVDRRSFDAGLASAGEAAGASVLRGATVTKVHRRDDGWRVWFRSPGGERALDTAWLIDASGRSAMVAKAAGASHIRYDRLFGLVGVLHGAHRPGAFLLLEAAEDCWWYSVPLPGERLLAACMTDSDQLHRGSTATAQWRARLKSTTHTAERLRGLELDGAVVGRRADTLRLDRVVGEGWIAAGDAAATYDPLSADGVVKALRLGIEAADVVLDESPTAAKRYTARHDAAFERYLKQRTRYYGYEDRWPNSLFWRRRATDGLSAPVTLDPEAVIAPAASGAPMAAIPELEAVLPAAELERLAAVCAGGGRAHELVRAYLDAAPSSVGDRRVVIALQHLIDCGSLKLARAA